jgi:hypothetical protein
MGDRQYSLDHLRLVRLVRYHEGSPLRCCAIDQAYSNSIQTTNTVNNIQKIEKHHTVLHASHSSTSVHNRKITYPSSIPGLPPSDFPNPNGVVLKL